VLLTCGSLDLYLGYLLMQQPRRQQEGAEARRRERAQSDLEQFGDEDGAKNCAKDEVARRCGARIGAVGFLLGDRITVRLNREVGHWIVMGTVRRKIGWGDEGKWYPWKMTAKFAPSDSSWHIVERESGIEGPVVSWAPSG
jgi:hypothetical protein